MIIKISTKEPKQIIDITDLINQNLSGEGIVNLTLLHTTAAIALADLDPETDLDYLAAIKKLTPLINWHHPHNPSHFPDHLWSTIIGQSVSLQYDSAKLVLGTWQRLILIELDGPRERLVSLKTI